MDNLEELARTVLLDAEAMACVVLGSEVRSRLYEACRSATGKCIPNEATTYERDVRLGNYHALDNILKLFIDNDGRVPLLENLALCVVEAEAGRDLAEAGLRRYAPDTLLRSNAEGRLAGYRLALQIIGPALALDAIFIDEGAATS